MSHFKEVTSRTRDIEAHGDPRFCFWACEWRWPDLNHCVSCPAGDRVGELRADGTERSGGLARVLLEELDWTTLAGWYKLFPTSSMVDSATGPLLRQASQLSLESTVGPRGERS